MTVLTPTPTPRWTITGLTHPTEVFSQPPPPVEAPAPIGLTCNWCRVGQGSLLPPGACALGSAHGVPYHALIASEPSQPAEGEALTVEWVLLGQDRDWTETATYRAVVRPLGLTLIVGFAPGGTRSIDPFSSSAGGPSASAVGATPCCGTTYRSDVQYATSHSVPGALESTISALCSACGKSFGDWHSFDHTRYVDLLTLTGEGPRPIGFSDELGPQYELWLAPLLDPLTATLWAERVHTSLTQAAAAQARRLATVQWAAHALAEGEQAVASLLPSPWPFPPPPRISTGTDLRALHRLSKPIASGASP